MGLPLCQDRLDQFTVHVGESHVAAAEAEGLLRVLDASGEYQRLGDSRTLRADFRLLAATNRPIAALKSDLLARFSVRLHVPAYFASEMLLPRLSEFSKLHDGIDLRIDTSGGHGRQHVAEADISIVVGTGPWNGLVAHPLFAQTMVPACSPELLAEMVIHVLG